MPNLNISINTRRPFGRSWLGRRGVRELADWLRAIESGAVQSDAVVYSAEDTAALGTAAYAGQAVCALVGSTLTGSVGATIDGTAVTVTAAGGDTATQTLLQAAIAANASVNRKVTVARRIMQVSLASVVAGTTLDVFGARFTAVASAGAVLLPGDFDISGSDTADATSLALAINNHPSLAGRVRAVSSVAIVYIGMLEDRAPTAVECVGVASASTITVTTKVPTAGAVMLLVAAVPGQIGNCCTVVASGTGMSVVTANAGKLGSGTGGGTTFNYLVP